MLCSFHNLFDKISLMHEPSEKLWGLGCEWRGTGACAWYDIHFYFGTKSSMAPPPSGHSLEIHTENQGLYIKPTHFCVSRANHKWVDESREPISNQSPEETDQSMGALPTRWLRKSYVLYLCMGQSSDVYIFGNWRVMAWLWHFYLGCLDLLAECLHHNFGQLIF